MSRVVVTGIGIISSIGNSVDETYNSLIKNKSGISGINILETKHKDEFLLGEINQTHEQLIQTAGVSSDQPWTRTALLGIIAAKQAISNSGYIDVENSALISASTVGGMDRSELHYTEMLSGQNKKYIDTHHAGNSTEMIARQCGLNGVVTTISTACSSSLNSIMFGARLIKSGKTKVAVVGGADSLSKFTLNGFNTLMILDKEHCRPFDDARSGLNLGEGAAYLVLEELESALESGKKIYAEVSGYANANDAHHQTASSVDGEGPFLAMKNALNEAGLSPKQIDYINAHGTGTENNDLTEGKALLRLFGDNVPHFSSTKASTGHTLGAAGVIEAVISLIALNENILPPNINFKNTIPEIGLVPVCEVLHVENMLHVLTNSFGFGGNDSSVVFSKVTRQNSTVSGISKSMAAKPVYIVGTSCVSPQATFGSNFLPFEITEFNERFLQVQKPEYRKFIAPKLLRRMSKIVRMSIVSSMAATDEAGIDKPDAIVTATGMGCQVDTEKFLKSMIENGEELLTPTSFIQSTHNTVGGSIALGTGNHNYNLTYVHRTFSFESALLDSMMLIGEDKASSVLLGGFDEITEESWLIKTKIDFYKSKEVSNIKVYNDPQKGAQAGEGSTFFVVSAKRTTNTYARVLGVDMNFSPDGKANIENRIQEFLNSHDITKNDIDLLILGENGDPEFDKNYANLRKGIFSNQNIINYKHLCGEYDTSSAFAMWLGALIIKEKYIPKELLMNDIIDSKISNVLIYNHFRNTNHSLILLGS
jgi:3-oxoacyl-(acyl-carrier-protein) synthase